MMIYAMGYGMCFCVFSPMIMMRYYIYRHIQCLKYLIEKDGGLFSFIRLYPCGI